MQQTASWWNELFASRYAQQNYLFLCYITKDAEIFHLHSLLRSAQGAEHNPNLQTRWPDDVALGNCPTATPAGWWIQDRTETLAGPSVYPEAWPRSRREAAVAVSLGGRQDRLILILSNMAGVTEIRGNPGGWLFIFIFWKHRRLNCFLARNERIFCSDSPELASNSRPTRSSSALSSTEGPSTPRATAKGWAGPETSAPSSQPPAFKDAAAVVDMWGELASLCFPGKAFSRLSYPLFPFLTSSEFYTTRPQTFFYWVVFF